MSHFLPGNAETIIDYDCVPTYSQSLAAQIINMDDNLIVSKTSLKSGKIATIIFYVDVGDNKIEIKNSIG